MRWRRFGTHDALYDKGNLEGDIAEYRKALALEPEDAGIYHILLGDPRDD
jgi:hypothetical protein